MTETTWFSVCWYLSMCTNRKSTNLAQRAPNFNKTFMYVWNAFNRNFHTAQLIYFSISLQEFRQVVKSFNNFGTILKILNWQIIWQNNLKVGCLNTEPKAANIFLELVSKLWILASIILYIFRIPTCQLLNIKLFPYFKSLQQSYIQFVWSSETINMARGKHWHYIIYFTCTNWDFLVIL